MFKEALAIGAAATAIGTGIGVWSEVEGNEDARGRVITIDTCMKTYHQNENTISQRLEDCLEAGVPGGEMLGDKVDADEPIEFVGSARTHEQDRSNFSVGRIAVYSAAAPVVVAGGVVWVLTTG